MTIRNDPGMTASYYANRYFGKETIMMVNHMLWSQLKRHGKITLDRSDGVDSPPKWYPTFDTPRQHGVARHNPDDEDLSVLKNAADSDAASPRHTPAAPLTGVDAGEVDILRVEALVLHLVQKEPRRDIQYYIGLLPFEMRMNAPLTFKRLRESGLLTREATPLGTFVWL